MTKSRFLIAFVGLLAVLFVAGCGSSVSVPTGSVAVVDGQEVTQEQLDTIMARVKKSYEANKQEFPKAGSSDYTALQNQAVAYLVQIQEYEQQAKDLGVSISDADVDKRVVVLKKQYFGGDEAKFKKQIATQGYTPETFRDEARLQILQQKLYANITKNVKVSDADAQAYYNKNKAQYTTAESRKVRHILVKTKAEAESVYQQLQNGADFKALVTKYSLDTGSKQTGGELTATKGQLVPPFEKVAFSLPVNTISKPVKSQYGYHIIEAVSAVTPASVTAFAKVKAQIVAQLKQQKQSDAVATWTADVTKKFKDKVSYATGFEPPAAATTSTSGTTTG